MLKSGEKANGASKLSSKSSKSKSPVFKASDEDHDPSKGPKDRNYFLKYPQSIWHEQATELPALDSQHELKDENRILRLKEEAKQLYEKLSHEYEEGM